MAIKPVIKKDGYDFLRNLKHQLQSVTTLIGLVMSTILTIGTLWVAQSGLALEYKLSIIFIVSFLLIGMSASIISLLAIAPLQKLVNTIMFQVKPNTSIAPELVNQPANIESGFNNLLQFIYQSSQPVPQKKQSTQLIKAFDQAKLGLIMIRPDGSVAYANKLGKSLWNDGDLSVNYGQDQSIAAWIKQAQSEQISAIQSWHRISSDALGEERQFFDIEVNFRKDEEVESIITILERTEFYRIEEEDFDFIAFAAHELRGPITIIKGYLDILEYELGDSLSDEHKQIFDRLIVSANRLSSYINNILGVSKYDRKHLKVTLHEETVQELLDSVMEDVQLRAVTQNRLLSFEPEDNLPTVAADISSVSEVLVNLIDNAIKYSHNGGLIIVKIYRQGDFVYFAVTDRGIGMPSSVVKNLFKKFYRSHRSRETVGGTGIGLYLSKAIVDSHGGSITVKSTDSEGSTFTFSLPIFATVAEKLRAAGYSNQALINNQADGWIRNHGLYKD